MRPKVFAEMLADGLHIYNEQQKLEVADKIEKSILE
jgi:hypothetical protein